MIDLKRNTLFREIPENLLTDKRVVHLAEALQASLNRMLEWSDKINYRRNIEDLPEEIIEHLLWESHIGYTEGLALATTREHKINLVQNAVELHRIKGTPAALEMVFRLVDIDCKLQEWFEYGGVPYHFKLEISVRDKGLDEETLNLLTELVSEFKNVRSYLEAIDIYLSSHGFFYIGSCSLFGEEITVYPWKAKSIELKGAVSLGSFVQSFEAFTVYPQ